jgi:hypothetical protein
MCVSMQKDFSKKHYEFENCNFESCRITRVFSSIVENPASRWSLVQGSTPDCGVPEYDRESSTMKMPWPTRGCRNVKKNYVLKKTSYKGLISTIRLLCTSQLQPSFYSQLCGNKRWDVTSEHSVSLYENMMFFFLLRSFYDRHLRIVLYTLTTKNWTLFNGNKASGYFSSEVRKNQ